MDVPLFMDAVISRNRTLSPRGLRTLFSILIGIDVVLGVVFALMGAGLVAGFMALAAVALGVAFAINNRHARELERVQVSPFEVRVVRCVRAEETVVWTSPTAFTRVELIDGEASAGEVHLRLRERQVEVAQALSRPERLAFAEALEAAIRQAQSASGW
ncbi:MAG TPA: DUF2244 domain-containing protein [Caulobacteraceae bacterium]|jgi:uncharacterized membrane protein|nr:DUF2244 domain-containing protein [Caulobacteraceae bacterium]